MIPLKLYISLRHKLRNIPLRLNVPPKPNETQRSNIPLKPKLLQRPNIPLRPNT